MYTFLCQANATIGNLWTLNLRSSFQRWKCANLMRFKFQVIRTMQPITCEAVLIKVIRRIKIILLIVMKSWRRTISRCPHRPMTCPTLPQVTLSAWVHLNRLLLKENVWDNLCWLRTLTKGVLVGMSPWVTLKKNLSLLLGSVSKYRYNSDRARDSSWDQWEERRPSWVEPWR